MKKTLLYLIIGAAALTFVACEKKVEVTKEKEAEVTKEEPKTPETKAAEKPAEHTTDKPTETVVKDGEKVEVNKADAPNNPQPLEAQDNMPKMQNEPAAAPAEQK